MNLNEKQKEAVHHVEGPLLVLAGAGSGKTRVLTERISHLVEKCGVDPIHILAITFTNKASNEMRERIIKRIGPCAYDMWILTFHSLGLRIIKENYHLVGYEKNFCIMDTDDTLTIIKRLLKEKGYDPKEFNPRAIKNKISDAKNHMVDEMEYMNYAKTDFEEIVGEIYKSYAQELKKNNAMDFDDLLLLPLELFRNYGEILKRYQEKFQYILVDEYQDTNEPQYLLTKMLAKKHKNLCVVGDNDQSIYAFRGANYKNILNFEKDYPTAKVVLLEENYRSTKTILNAANRVIQNNTQRKDKNLWSKNEEGAKIVHYCSYDERDESNFVVQEIYKLIEQGERYDDIAVLYRTNAQSRAMEEAILKENFPYRVVGSFYFYNREEIKNLISYLRLINNTKDDVSLRRIINVPKRGIGATTVERLALKATIENVSMFDAIEGGKELTFQKTIKDLIAFSETATLTEMIEEILEKSGMRRELKADKDLKSENKLENLEEFKSITMRFEEKNGIVSLNDFLDEITLVSDISEHEDEKGKLTLMTVHSAKGLEFNNVFLIGMEEGIFPHMNAMLDHEELEEERRLCYVAITRAKKKLYMVRTRRRILFGKEQANPPSRFLEEVGEDYLETNTFQKREEKSFVKEEMFTTEDVDYAVGDMVQHDKYGAGVVVSVDKSLVSVAFAYGYGIKKLMKNHKSLRKVS